VWIGLCAPNLKHALKHTFFAHHSGCRVEYSCTPSKQDATVGGGRREEGGGEGSPSQQDAIVGGGAGGKGEGGEREGRGNTPADYGDENHQGLLNSDLGATTEGATREAWAAQTHRWACLIVRFFVFLFFLLDPIPSPPCAAALSHSRFSCVYMHIRVDTYIHTYVSVYSVCCMYGPKNQLQIGKEG